MKLGRERYAMGEIDHYRGARGGGGRFGRLLRARNWFSFFCTSMISRVAGQELPGATNPMDIS